MKPFVALDINGYIETLWCIDAKSGNDGVAMLFKESKDGPWKFMFRLRLRKDDDMNPLTSGDEKIGNTYTFAKDYGPGLPGLVHNAMLELRNSFFNKDDALHVVLVQGNPEKLAKVMEKGGLPFIQALRMDKGKASPIDPKDLPGLMR
jgi:hypothetical protein